MKSSFFKEKSKTNKAGAMGKKRGRVAFYAFLGAFGLTFLLRGQFKLLLGLFVFFMLALLIRWFQWRAGARTTDRSGGDGDIGNIGDIGDIGAVAAHDDGNFWDFFWNSWGSDGGGDGGDGGDGGGGDGGGD